MKILHTEASCGWGGQEIRILEESRGLIGRGHEVTVACPAHARMAAEASRFGVPVVALPIEFKTIAGFRALRRYLLSNHFDIVNTHSSSDSWLVALACATVTRPPDIVRTRHISAQISGNPFNRWLYRQARTVVTTGESLRQHVIKAVSLNPTHVISVPTGIDTKRFVASDDKAATKTTLGLNPDKKYIGIVATLRSWKGHLFLLDAFANLNRPGWELLIVGDGPQRAAIGQRIEELGLTQSVRMAGQQNHPEDWLRAMDIFCLPSYANEGVPQALLQAMLTGLPIVSTPVGSILEAVTDKLSALIVPPKDFVALSKSLRHLIDDQQLAHQLGVAARLAAESRYSLTGMLDQMEAIFQGRSS